jgi:predicted nucleic acid-binding protein
MYLLDTNVVSEIRKIKSGRADAHVEAWIGSAKRSILFVSVVSILELETGAGLKERRDLRQGRALRIWLEQQVLPFFEGRILPIDLEVARRCAPLHVPDPRSGVDALIAATALVHRMTVVTRNTADFAAMKVSVFNPWKS